MWIYCLRKIIIFTDVDTLSHQTWNDMIPNLEEINDLTFHEKQKPKSAIGLLRSLFSQNLGSLTRSDNALPPG